jgi:cardiolipin synthase
MTTLLLTQIPVWAGVVLVLYWIAVLVFLVDQDREPTPQITQILLERVAAGVDVRILYDNIGSRAYGKDELKRLARAGAQVTADVTERAQLNYRDHRRVTVVDGEIGYTGGSNMGQEYIDGGERFATWRDTNIRITG